MKRIALLVLICLAAASAALAEGMPAFEEMKLALSELTEAEWEEEGPVRILTLESGTTVSVCLEDALAAAVTVEALLEGGALEEAQTVFALAGLIGEEQLPEMAEIGEDGSAQVGEVLIYRLSGELRESYAVCAAEEEDLVWQPVHGGKKLHLRLACSGMDVARLMTAEAAQRLGLEPCGRCAKELLSE